MLPILFIMSNYIEVFSLNFANVAEYIKVDCFEKTTTLTHLSLSSHKRDNGKQYRPRSDAASDQGQDCLH